MERRDYYGDLRLPFGASEAVIRQRYKRLARKYHPDVNPAPDAAERFRRVREAYEVLSDPAKRRAVDSWCATSRRGVRRRYRASGAAEPNRKTPRRRKAPGQGADRLWSFGCFGAAAFVLSLLTSLWEIDGASERALFVALGVGALVGLVAALGGARAREWLLWLFYWAWP